MSKMRIEVSIKELDRGYIVTGRCSQMLWCVDIAMLSFAEALHFVSLYLKDPKKASEYINA